MVCRKPSLQARLNFDCQDFRSNFTVVESFLRRVIMKENEAVTITIPPIFHFTNASLNAVMEKRQNGGKF